MTASDYIVFGWVICLFLWGASILYFGQVTFKRINKRIRESGEYCMSIDDKIGFSFVSMAFAIVFPEKFAQRFIFKGMLDVELVKSLVKNPKDKIAALFFLIMSVIFFSYMIIDVNF